MTKLDMIIKESDAYRIYENLNKLVSLGNRFAGSKVDNLAAEFVHGELNKNQFKVINEEFKAHVFEEKESYIKISDIKIPSRAMFFSESTNNELEAEAIIVGYGQEEDYTKVDVKNKIVIVLRSIDKDDYWADVSRASKNGAVGFVLINYYSWPTITTLETGFFDPEKRLAPVEPNPIPAIVLGKEEGEKVINLINSGYSKLKLMVDAFNGERSVTNVRAIKLGEEKADEKIVIYGHRDTAGTPGANDNGSGTVIMLEIANVLKDIKLKRTIEIISLSAEEHLGSIGSIAYLEKHRDNLDEIVASIELDMVGVGSSINVMEGGAWKEKDIYFSQELTNYVIDVAKEMGYLFEKDFSQMCTPDSGRFAELGIPTTWIWCPDDIHYHSPEDTIEKVDINKLKIISDVVATAICNIANK